MHIEGPEAIDLRVPCAECGSTATRVQLVPPGGKPRDWANWRPKDRVAFDEYNDPGKWRMVYEGIEGGNGFGDQISEETAKAFNAAFAEPLNFKDVHTAGLYDDAGFCELCAVPYCFAHWNTGSSGYGHCPKGHGKSLDPHWSSGF